MENEQQVSDALKRIERDAPTQQIDFANPANAFTVWVDFHPFMKYCGCRQTLDSAWILASEHVNQKDLYIVNAEISPLGILRFEK